MYTGQTFRLRRDHDAGGDLSGFSAAHLSLLKEAGRTSVWGRGDVLMREGAPSDRAILLESGLVKLTAEAANGYTSLLAIRGAGELVGELGCVDGRPRGATVTAMRHVRGVIIGAAQFRALLEANGKLALDVLRCVCGRLRDADGRRTEHGAHIAPGRVARVLLDLALRHGGAVPGRPRARSVAVTQQELAGACGTSRESVVRTLRMLQDEDLVARARGMVLVLDPPKLAAWAHDTGRN